MGIFVDGWLVTRGGDVGESVGGAVVAQRGAVVRGRDEAGRQPDCLPVIRCRL